MDNRKRELLDKWLSGAITYMEEVELFELAEEDRMLKDALEGYIGQQAIEPISPVKIKEWQQSVKATEIEARTASDASGNRKKIALVAVLLIAILGSVFSLFVSGEGEQAKSVIVEVNEPTDLKTFQQEEIAGDMKADLLEEVTENKIVGDKPTHSLAEVDLDNNTSEEQIVMDHSVATTELESTNEQEEIVIVNDENATNDLIAESSEENQIEEEANTLKQSVFISMTEQEANQFNDEADDQLRDKVYDDAKKELANEIPITAFDINISSGVNPNHPEPYVKDSMIGNDVVNVEGIESQTEATSQNKSFKTNNVTSNLVIKEYEINKADIYNPPMEDYNSLVRAKYKRKGKPEGGYLKYKQFLRASSTVLVDSYKNTEHLEEVLIKFRVYKTGEVEFLELFGIENEQCIDEIKKAISKGPKWQLQDYYESIDIEIPFKVLYPFLF
ncbi:MAG: hypothetical protein R2730_16450 [Chitinophagales bacterium]